MDLPLSSKQVKTIFENKKTRGKLSDIGFDTKIGPGQTSTKFLEIHLNCLTDDYCACIKPNAKSF